MKTPVESAKLTKACGYRNIMKRNFVLHLGSRAGADKDRKKVGVTLPNRRDALDSQPEAKGPVYTASLFSFRRVGAAGLSSKGLYGASFVRPLECAPIRPAPICEAKE